MAFEKLRRKILSTDKNLADINKKLNEYFNSDWMQGIPPDRQKQLEKNVQQLMATKYGKELEKIERDDSLDNKKKDKAIKKAYNACAQQTLDVLRQYRREFQKEQDKIESAKEDKMAAHQMHGRPQGANLEASNEVAAILKVVMFALKILDKAGGAVIGLREKRRQWDYTYDGLIKRLKKWGGQKWYQHKKEGWREKADDIEKHPENKVRFERKLREKISEIQPIFDEYKTHHDELVAMAMEQSAVIKKDRDALGAWKVDQDKKSKQLDAYVRFAAAIKKSKEYKEAMKGIQAGDKKVAAIVKTLEKEENDAIDWFKDAKTRGANTLGQIGGVLEPLKNELKTSLAKTLA